MDVQAIKKWAKTAVMAGVGGGITATLAAAFDPMKYNIAHDLGSGKLWKFFFEGFAVTFGALLLKSPLGQQVMGSIREAQQTAKEDAAMLDKVKSDLKTGAVSPPANGPVTK